MTITVTRAAREDVHHLVELMGEFYREDGDPFDPARATAAFTELLKHDQLGTAWLIRCDGALAGYLACPFTLSLEYGGRTAFVDDLFVRPQYRGRGCGRQAMETVLADCRRRGVRAVHLEVWPANTVARRLYASLGFEHPGRDLLTVRLAAPEA